MPSAPPPVASPAALRSRPAIPARLLALAAALVLAVTLLQPDLFQRGVASDGPMPPPRHWGGEPVAPVSRPSGAGEAEVFRLAARFLFIPDAGAGDATVWRLRILDEAGGVAAELQPAQAVRPPLFGGLRLDVAAWQGSPAQLLPGGDAGAGDALPALDPLRLAALPDGVQTLPEPARTNYGIFVLATGLILILLWLPGLVLARWWPSDRRLAPAWVPLPGLLLLGAVGLVLWLSGTAANARVAQVYLTIHLLAALALAATPRRTRATVPDEAWPDALLAYGGLTLAVLALSVAPLPIAYEGFAGYSLHSRLPATAGDHAIPFVTAAYFQTGRDGKEESDRYFSPDWSAGSRGPLPSLATVTLFNALGVAPPDPLGPSVSAFPAANDAFFISRIFGVFSNGLVLLGALELLRALGGAQRRRPLLAWTMLAPAVLLNTLFVWPKMLAAFFVLLAASEIIHARRPVCLGLLCALAWLSHPVGALFAPLLGLFFLHEGWRRRDPANPLRPLLVRTLAVLIGGGLLMLPWLGYKVWLGAKDVFLSYPLGDGHAFAPATSVGTWLTARWHNLLYTVVPFAHILSDHSRGWAGEPMNEFVRWVVQATKSIPAGVGLVMTPLAYLALCRRSRFPLSAAKTWLIGAALLLMLVYWGYSRDGLGRNCLEPLTVALLVIACAQGMLDGSRRYWWLALLAIETLVLLAASFAGAPTFNPSQITAPVVAAWSLAALGLLGPLVWWATRRVASGNAKRAHRSGGARVAI